MAEKPDRRLVAERLWNYALRLLSGRAYSTGELREKLRRFRSEQREKVLKESCLP